MAFVAIAYVASAKLGLALSVAYSNVTPIWAPAGISLAALLILGRRAWPAVALGAFVANVTTPIPAWTAGAIAAGNTLEALVGAELLKRLGRFHPALDRVKDVLSLVLWGAVVSTAIAATIGTAALLLAGEIEGERYVFAWQLWWYGDAIGVILVAPLVLAWTDSLASPRGDRRRMLEEVAFLGALAATGWVVFFGGNWRYPYVLFPFLIIAALRYRQRGAATASFVVAGIAIWGTLGGSVPVGGATLTSSVQILQTLTSILSVTTLLLAASLSEREKAEREMAASLSLLGATLDSTNDGILVVDLEGRIVNFNQRFIDLWRIPEEIAQSRNDKEVIRSVLDQLRDPDHFEERIHSIYAEPEGTSNDLIEFKDGRILERHSQAQRIDGRPVGRVWSFRDISGQRKMEDARRRFINDAAHELRTPISVMHGFLEMLTNASDSLGPAETDEALRAVARHGDRLRVLIDRMLDLGRMESHDTRMQLRPLKLLVAVTSATDALPVPTGKTLEVDIPRDLDVFVDEIAMDQVVTNLVVNAYRYGGEHLEIRADLQGQLVSLAFADDGPGVGPDLVDHLFEPFSRASSSKEPDGAGLGLAIVRSLSEAMGGSVRYEPRPGGGSIFIVSLPAGGQPASESN